jgi:ankyrin repeat protein
MYNRTDNDGFSPLYVACRNGHVDIVCTLLEHRADIDLSNNNGVSPLYITCLTGYLQVVCTLLENNAEVNLGKSALHSNNFLTICKWPFLQAIYNGEAPSTWEILMSASNSNNIQTTCK